MLFCSLEKDDKTFKLILEFVKKVKGGVSDLELNHFETCIQKDEIYKHLEVNGCQENNRKDEILKWVQQHAHNFRNYLNTLKIASVMWVYANPDKEFTWEEFCILENRLNNEKDILDSIH